MGGASPYAWAVFLSRLGTANRFPSLPRDESQDTRTIGRGEGLPGSNGGEILRAIAMTGPYRFGCPSFPYVMQFFG
jgi:hypothetical protein